jgi:polar amino acid transport system permease protein
VQDFWPDALEFAPVLLAGAWTTVKLSVVSMTIALLLGTGFGVARGASNPLLRYPAAFYIDFLRGTPLLLQIFYVYYALPLVGIRFGAFEAGILSLGINYSAYLAEVFRAGIQAIPPGQREAASSLGMSSWLGMRRIILPQAFRVVIPPIANYSVGMIKDSALVSVIAVTDLLRAGQLLAATTFKFFEIYTFVAFLYLTLCYPLTLLIGAMESRLRSRADRPARIVDTSPGELITPLVSDEEPKTDPVAASKVPSSRPIISLRSVCRAFNGHAVLDRISLAVKSGEVIVVLGPSGSGKSTLLRTIIKLETIDSGNIIINDADIWSGNKTSSGRLSGRDAASLDVGMVFQQFNLFPHLTALENVMEAPVHVGRLGRREAEGRAMALLQKVGLLQKAKAYPAKLSGGQQQRVAIARALAMQPKIMLFDEVTSALDPELVGEVLRVMRQLARDGMTMFVVTHEIGFAREVADRILFLADGRVIEDTSAEAFFGGPRTERAQAFLASHRH